MAHPIVQMMVGMLAEGKPVEGTKLRKCDFEDCPGRNRRNKKKLIYHSKYLFVHNQCVPGARAAANRRGEVFAFRLGL